MELVFHWVRYVLILWGLVYIVTQSAIMLPFRIGLLRMSTFFGALVFCPACSGFWLGLILGAPGIYGPPLSQYSYAWAESAVISTVLGYFWTVYFGDPHGLERAIHAVKEHDAA
jgi:hypothetical protein